MYNDGMIMGLSRKVKRYEAVIVKLHNKEQLDEKEQEIVNDLVEKAKN